MPTTGLLSDLEDERKRELLAQMLATDPELRRRTEEERTLGVRAKTKSRLKMLKRQLLANPELKSMLKYTTLKMEEL